MFFILFFFFLFPPLERWRRPCSCVNFCSSFLSPPCPAPGPCCTELLSPGVQRSFLRTSSLSSAHSDSRPNSPFRHHFLPHVKGKEAGFSRQHPAKRRFISALGRLIRCISKSQPPALDLSACLRASWLHTRPCLRTGIASLLGRNMSFLRALDEVTGSTLETLRLLLSCLGKNIYYHFAFLCVRSKI